MNDKMHVGDYTGGLKNFGNAKLTWRVKQY